MRPVIEQDLLIDRVREHYTREYQKMRLWLPTQTAFHAQREQALTGFSIINYLDYEEIKRIHSLLNLLIKTPFTGIEPTLPHFRHFKNHIINQWIISHDCYRLVFIDGHHVPHLSHLKGIPESAIMTSLASHSLQEPEILKDIIQRNSTQAHTALNAAFIHDGAYIDLPPNVPIQKPIELLFLTTTNQANFIPVFNLIRARENSQAVILERHISTVSSNTYLNSVVTELTLERSAQVQYYKLLEEGDKAIHISQFKIEQKENSNFHSYALILKGLLSHNNTYVQLLDKQAHCRLQGLYFSKGRQQINHFTSLEHLAPHTKSWEHFSGVVTGQSRTAFHAKIIIHPLAAKSHSQLLNKNLLLSNQAEIETKPEFEILTDDVYCTHGATVGQLSQEALFYLCSRGLDLGVARALLLRAFIKKIADTMPLIPTSLLESYMQKMVPAYPHDTH